MIESEEELEATLQMLWESLLTQNPHTCYIRSIVIQVPELAEQAMEHLSISGGTNEDWMSIIIQNPLFSLRAWQELKKNPTIENEILGDIVAYGKSSPIQNKAAERLLKQKPSNGDLRTIICTVTDQNIRIRAAKALLQQTPMMVDALEIIEAMEEIDDPRAQGLTVKAQAVQQQLEWADKTHLRILQVAGVPEEPSEEFPDQAEIDRPEDDDQMRSH